MIEKGKNKKKCDIEEEGREEEGDELELWGLDRNEIEKEI